MKGPKCESVVLLVDDDARLAALTGDWLEEHGFVMDYASCGADALAIATNQHFDAIVLDIEMPGVDGISVCRRLREGSRATTPIMMLSGNHALKKRLDAFEAGADDYLTKPFAADELVARLKGLVKRDRDETARDILELDDVRADTLTGLVTRAGRHVNVLKTGFEILAILMHAHPRVVARTELQQRLWGQDMPQSDSLRSHIYQLRRSLNSGGGEELICTIAGVGLRFRAPREGEDIADQARSTHVARPRHLQNTPASAAQNIVPFRRA